MIQIMLGHTVLSYYLKQLTIFNIKLNIFYYSTSLPKEINSDIIIYGL